MPDFLQQLLMLLSRKQQPWPSDRLKSTAQYSDTPGMGILNRPQEVEDSLQLHLKKNPAQENQELIYKLMELLKRSPQEIQQERTRHLDSGLNMGLMGQLINQQSIAEKEREAGGFSKPGQIEYPNNPNGNVLQDIHRFTPWRGS